MTPCFRQQKNKQTIQESIGLADIRPQIDVVSAAKVPKCSQGDIILIGGMR